MKNLPLVLLWVLLILNFYKLNAQEYERPPAFALKVYNDLYRSMNDNKTLKPKLVVQKDSRQVAAYNPKGGENGEPVIILGTEFIQLVRSFGKDSMNALAHVLGHEMAHVFLNQNDLISSIGIGYASKELNDQLKKYKKTLQDSLFERQADEHSAFYCHVAGYRTVHLGEDVLDSIYRRFQLNDSLLSRYPALEERKEIVRNSQRKMGALKIMFDDGVIALIAGKYDMGRVFFRTIIKEGFNSREMYNNLGLTFLMKALDELDSLEFPFVFPAQIDVISKLEKDTERGVSSDTRGLLEEALDNFNRAAQNAEDYPIAWINKAIVEFLLEDYSSLEESLKLVDKSGDVGIRYSVQVLNAIYRYKVSKDKKSLKTLKKLSVESLLAKRNYYRIKGEIPKGSHETVFPSVIKNFIDGAIPNHNFSTQEAKQGRDLISSLLSKNDYSLRIGSDDKFDSRRWIYLHGKTQPRMDLYSGKSSFKITDKDWEMARNSAERVYSNSGVEYLKIKPFIFKKVKDDVYFYIVK